MLCRRSDATPLADSKTSVSRMLGRAHYPFLELETNIMVFGKFLPRQDFDPAMVLAVLFLLHQEPRTIVACRHLRNMDDGRPKHLIECRGNGHQARVDWKRTCLSVNRRYDEEQVV
jgi:hypothetical protein